MAAHRDLTIPPFASVWAQMEVDEAAVRESTRDARMEGPLGAAVKAGVVLGLIGFILGILVYVVSNLLGLLIGLAGLALLGVSAFVALTQAGTARQSFSQSVGTPLMEQLLAGMSAPGAAPAAADGSAPVLRASYALDGTVPARTLASAGLVYDTQMVQEDVITGRLGDTEFVLADLKWQSAVTPEERARETSEPSARQRREWRSLARQELRESGLRISRSAVNDRAEYMYWKSKQKSELQQQLERALEKKRREVEKLGPSLVFFSADFHRPFASETYFLPSERTRGLTSLDREEAAETELEPAPMAGLQLPDGVEGWSTDPAEAHSLLTPQLIETLSAFIAEMGTESVGVSFTGSRINLAFSVDVNLFSLDPTSADIRGTAERIYTDVARFLHLVQDLDRSPQVWARS
ncbi:DUF3137 domain-containing protein [Brachybacterium sp. Marseille-Q7125]|uniref:DUF3137 domain-containing protein n=1 Tax=Brachybacterium sp. Marseille-Q7125 TaxID=2932815 RepID=UPI001FF6235B|nr:DUF3137 domain-containing protein [Brachybacterium sp. Marseille-Q7125]